MKSSLPSLASVQKVLCIFCALFCGVVSAQEPKVRTSIEAKGELFVGQKATLVVELLAPGFFAGAAAFDLPNAPGLLLVPPSGSPVVSSETIGDTAYTVQRHEVAVFARRAGEQTIPPFAVRFKFKRHPLDKDAVATSVKTEAVHFTAKTPAGAEKLGNVISARNLQVEETWKPEPGKSVKAGDAFTRTIAFTAPDVPAMAFPPFPARKIDGLGIYAKPPEVLDEGNRGNLTGKRRDVITYVCQRPGQFLIPAARLTWYDLDAQKLQTIDFPARTFEVLPNPALASATKAAPSHVISSRYLVGGLLAAITINLILLAAARTRSKWLRWFAPFRAVHLAPLNPSAELPHPARRVRRFEES